MAASRDDTPTTNDPIAALMDDLHTYLHTIDISAREQLNIEVNQARAQKLFNDITDHRKKMEDLHVNMVLYLIRNASVLANQKLKLVKPEESLLLESLALYLAKEVSKIKRNSVLYTTYASFYLLSLHLLTHYFYTCLISTPLDYSGHLDKVQAALKDFIKHELPTPQHKRVARFELLSLMYSLRFARHLLDSPVHVRRARKLLLDAGNFDKLYNDSKQDWALPATPTLEDELYYHLLRVYRCSMLWYSNALCERGKAWEKRAHEYREAVLSLGDGSTFTFLKKVFALNRFQDKDFYFDQLHTGLQLFTRIIEEFGFQLPNAYELNKVLIKQYDADAIATHFSHPERAELIALKHIHANILRMTLEFSALLPKQIEGEMTLYKEEKELSLVAEWDDTEAYIKARKQEEENHHRQVLTALLEEGRRLTAVAEKAEKQKAAQQAKTARKKAARKLKAVALAAAETEPASTTSTTPAESTLATPELLLSPPISPKSSTSTPLDLSNVLSEDAKAILADLKADGYEACVVGGFLRDRLCQRDIHPNDDIDIVTNAPVSRVAKITSKQGKLGQFHGMQHPVYKLNDVPIEISWFKTDRHKCAAPEQVLLANGATVFVYIGHSIPEDAASRDFTPNALYWHDGLLIDPLNGQQAIQQRYLRFINSTQKSVETDPLRIIRAIRYAAKLNFLIAEDDLAILQASTHLLTSPAILMPVYTALSKTFLINETAALLTWLEKIHLLRGMLSLTTEQESKLLQCLRMAATHHRDAFDQTLIWTMLHSTTLESKLATLDVANQLISLTQHLIQQSSPRGVFIIDELYRLGIPTFAALEISIVASIKYLQEHQLPIPELPLPAYYGDQANVLSKLMAATLHPTGLSQFGILAQTPTAATPTPQAPRLKTG